MKENKEKGKRRKEKGEREARRRGEEKRMRFDKNYLELEQEKNHFLSYTTSRLIILKSHLNIFFCHIKNELKIAEKKERKVLTFRFEFWKINSNEITEERRVETDH